MPTACVFGKMRDVAEPAFASCVRKTHLLSRKHADPCGDRHLCLRHSAVAHRLHRFQRPVHFQNLKTAKGGVCPLVILGLDPRTGEEFAQEDESPSTIKLFGCDGLACTLTISKGHAHAFTPDNEYAGARDAARAPPGHGHGRLRREDLPSAPLPASPRQRHGRPEGRSAGRRTWRRG